MRTAGVVVSATLLLLCADLAPAQVTMLPAPELYQFRIAWDQFRSQVKGTVRRGEEGSLIDVKSDLAIGDKRTWDLRGDLQLKPGHKLRGSYLKIDYDGTAGLGRDLVFAGTVFEEGGTVVSSVKGNYFTGGYEFDFSQGSWGYVGATLGVKLFDVDAVLLSEEQGEREVETLRRTVPALGLASRLYFDRVSIGLEVSGFTLGSKGHIIEADGIARMHLSDRVAVEGGYRYLKVKRDETEDFADIELQGWIWGVELSL